MSEPRECWALYHLGTGYFIRAIVREPGDVPDAAMPIKYVHMREVQPMDPQTAADLDLMDRMVPPLKYEPWDELGQAWKRLRKRLGAE